MPSPKIPTFAKSSRLLRHIDPDFRARNGRTSPAAFRLKENETYLSVNSSEVETDKQIAAYYAKQMENGLRPVAISDPKVQDYSNAAAKVGLSVTYDQSKKQWIVPGLSSQPLAYMHEPRLRPPPSPSHSGIHFLAHCNEHQAFRFSVHMAKRKFRMV